jgi:hypothetical protein
MRWQDPARRRWSRAPRGEGRLGAYLSLLILFAGIYASIKLIPPYWTYLGMQEPVKAAALLASRPNGGALAYQNLATAGKEYGLVLTEEQIEITITDEKLTLRVAWEEPVEFFRYRKVLRFTIESSAPAP